MTALSVLDLSPVTTATPPAAALNNSLDLARHVDRKSTRLNSSHVAISYAVFCSKKKSSNRHHHTPILAINTPKRIFETAGLHHPWRIRNPGHAPHGDDGSDMFDHEVGVMQWPAS